MSDPTDPGGVGVAQAERVSRSTRVGDTGSPVGSPLTIILSVIAVVVGFLIFRTIDSGGSSAGEIGGGTQTTPVTTAAPAAGATTVPSTAAPPTSTVPTRTGATVVVANASRVDRAAAGFSAVLARAGYTMTDAVTYTGTDKPLATTAVRYVAGANPAVLAVAETLGNDLGGVDVTEISDSVPLEGGMGSATILVLLGDDLAGDEELPTGAGEEEQSEPTPPPIVGPTTTA